MGMIAAPDLSKEAPQTASYEAPVSEVTEASPSPSTTTVKYGELEHYNLGGYLPPPPPPSGYQPAPAPPPPQPSYQLPPVTPAAPAYDPPAPPPPPPPQL